jgi:hypothetical protein
LFRNEEGKRFRRRRRDGLPERINANTAIWLDYDRDGKLDLFIAGYFDEKLDLWNLQHTRIMPDSLEFATNGARKYLFRGCGDGTFEDVSDRMGLNTRKWHLAAAAADLRGTGYPDLVIANDYGVTELWANQNGQRLRETGQTTGVAGDSKSGMNVAFGDILNTGKFAIYVTNISEEGVLIQGNNLWVPREGSAPGTAYDNLARDMGVELGGWSFGAQFGDLNNDGTLDLYLTNGYVSGDPKRSYWYDYSKVTGGNKGHLDGCRELARHERPQPVGVPAKAVWINDGAGRFQDVALSVGASDRYDGRAVALADVNNDGTLDVLVANQKGPLLLYKNTCSPTTNGSPSICKARPRPAATETPSGRRCGCTGTASSRCRKSRVAAGFCAQNQRRLHFGLGKDAAVEKVAIRWPSGKMQIITAPKLGVVHTVKEPV